MKFSQSFSIKYYQAKIPSGGMGLLLDTDKTEMQM